MKNVGKSVKVVGGKNTSSSIIWQTKWFCWVFESEYDEELWPEIAKELCNACLTWLQSSNAEFVFHKTLKLVVSDPTFKKIVDVHLTVKKNGCPNLVPQYLIERTCCAELTPFLILYTFITGRLQGFLCRFRVCKLFLSNWGNDVTHAILFRSEFAFGVSLP
jgi:hypothetical protein